MLSVILSMALAPSTFLDARPKTSRSFLYLHGTPLDPHGNRIYGVTAVDILVDPTGRPSSCKVIHQVKVTLLGDWVCGQMLRNGRFYPAKDQNGTKLYAVFTYWYVSNLYDALASIPDRSTFWVPVNVVPAGVTNPHVEVRYLVDVLGKIEDCEVSASSGSTDLDRLSCQATRTVDFLPIANSKGIPQRTVRTRTIGFKIAS